MVISENTNLYANVNIKDGEFEKQIMNLSASINKDTNFNLNINVNDKELASKNTEYVQSEVKIFIDKVNAKLKELGYAITI